MVSPSGPLHQLETKGSQVQQMPAEIENKSFNRRLGEMGGIFHLLREMTHFTSQQTSFPMELLGAREGGRGRSGKCKSKTARAKLLAFSEQPLINCSLQELVVIKDTFLFKAGLIAQ